ncbi:MAG: elongation factor G [Verrucomicrobia bacterium]|jgi:elongation factor G|nr:elongation factor G [Verrucomicrobiota bacterium]
MKNIAISDVRNFAIMGHTGSGKTTLTDALLYRLGVNDRLGSPANGTSISDHTDEEKARKISIFATTFSSFYKTSAGKQVELVFTDTPGYMDFFGSVISSARAAETGVVVVDASSGIQVGTRRAWKCCTKRGLAARAIVITGLDKDNTDYAKTLADIQASFGSNCVPVVMPLPDCSGVIDILKAKDVPADLEDEVMEAKGGLVELAAETDDTLIEKYLAGEPLSPEEIASGLVDAVASGGFVPIFVCMPLKEIGIDELLEGASRFFASPMTVTHEDVEGNPVESAADAPFAGLVCRSVNDAFVGQLTFVRVFGGTLTSDTEVFNSSTQQKERVGNVLAVNGKKQTQVVAARAGDIVAIPKLKDTHVGNTLCAVGSNIVIDPIHFPSPVMFQAVTAKTNADEDKIGLALKRVCEEDPTLQVERNTETHEIILKGLGDVHIDVAVELMKGRSNVNVDLSTPKVPYHETVTGLGEGHYKHKKQSGGRGQFGEVYLRVEPQPADDEEWFANAVVGGAIPGNFIPAVQKGVSEGMVKGPLAGFSVTHVKSTVYDGSYHDVDSSEVAFKIAGSRALREAMLNAKPVLLEPIMSVNVQIPDDCMGDISGDLNHKRGRILGVGAEEGMQVVEADVPQAELFRYSAELRSMTGGRGTFEMTFSRYEQVPANVTQKVIAAYKREDEE